MKLINRALTFPCKQELEKGAGELRKKLDEYTKIVKWKDVNYFSVKQATEASHQKLAKFVSFGVLHNIICNH